MEILGLHRRVSSRASLACSTVRHLSTANHSIQSSSPSRPIAPIAMLPEVIDSTNRSNVRSSARPSPPLMKLGPQCLSNSSLSSVLPSAQDVSCGDGQFSDADTDGDITEIREKKRLKLDCFRSSERNCPQSAALPARRSPSPKLHVINHHHGGDHPKGSPIKKVATNGPTRKSQDGKNGVKTNSHRSKTTTPHKTSNQPSSSNFDSSSQLPMATRRLAMLVGIPESSQAIIQNIPSASTSKHPDATAPLPNSHRPTSSAYGGRPVGSLALSPSISSRINPALVANNDCRSPARYSSHVAANEASPNTVHCSTRYSSVTLTAPRYGRTSNSSHDFTMPAPGTFSIRAPPSSQILRSFGSDELSELTSRQPNKLDRSERGSEADVFSQAPSTYRAPSRDYGTPCTALTPGNTGADCTESRKRKARVSKPKTASQTGRKEGAENGIELVKPPPTINGKISHARKVPAGYVKRTPNSFLMFRSHVIANKLLPPGVENDNRQISRVVSGLWAGLSEDDLRTWQEASRELIAAVRAKNPGLKHAPNQKRKDVIRRRRNGQLPGETPEQRVEREKATAAALAKVIIEGRGEKIGKENLSPLANTPKQPSASNASIHSRETSRPEFRAPTYIFNNSTLIQGITPYSEYAESTLTNSPAPDTRRSLSCVPEVHVDVLGAHQVPLTPKTNASGPSSGKSPNECQNSTDRSPLAPVYPMQRNQLKVDAKPNPQSTLERVSPEIKSHQSLMSSASPQLPKELPPHSRENETSSNLFLALGSMSAPKGFPETFSNEMLRSYGLTASDLKIDFSAPDTLTTGTMNNSSASSNCFSAESDRFETNSAFWSQDPRFGSVDNFSPTQFPFRDLGISEGMGSQDSSIRNDEDSCDPLSHFETSNPLELSCLINDCYTEPLNCDGLNFDSLYLNCSPNPIGNLDLQESCQSFSTNLFENHLSNAIEPSNPNLRNTLWDCQDS